MNTLLFDTSTNTELVIISHKDTIIHSAKEPGISHSKTLFTSFQELFDKSNITIRDIDLIAVGIGPGSFTGIRIAVTTARMLAQALAIPLMGIKSTLIYAAGCNAEPETQICVIFDAKKNRVFGGLYKINHLNPVPEILVPAGDYPIEILLKEIDQNKEILFIGDGAEAFKETIKENCNTYGTGDQSLTDPNAIIDLCQHLYNENPLAYKSFENTLPFYARISDAEAVKLIKKQNGK